MRCYSITRSRRTTASACLLCLLLWGVSGASAGDGVVALQTAAASCADPTNTDRYIDCGNGTVTDNVTGLVWLASANCLGGGFDWSTAMELVAGLSDLPGDDPDDCGLSDGSSPGEWRLPSKAEWQAMVADADGLGCDPTITNDAGDGCWDAACVTAGDCSFSGVASFYWSATSDVGEPFGPSFVWVVSLILGDADDFVFFDSKGSSNYVWPVRGGQ
jgi:Protein of unknown function (DUF1566)